MKILSVVCVCLMVAHNAWANVVFDCDTLRPVVNNETVSDDMAQNNEQFEIIKSQDLVCAGASAQVTLRAKDGTGISFEYFILQARQSGSDLPTGIWTANSDDVTSRTWSCLNLADSSLCQTPASTSISAVHGTWTSPSNLGAGVEVDFVATVMNKNHEFWKGIWATITISQCGDISSNVPTNEQNEDNGALKEDQAQAKWRQHEQELIREEDEYSEGEWQKRLEEVKRDNEKRIQEEMLEYERTKQEEEEARMARIRMEIRDQEEHGRDEEEEEEEEEYEDDEDKDSEDVDDNEIDLDDDKKTSGSTMVIISVISLLSFLLALLM